MEVEVEVEEEVEEVEEDEEELSSIMAAAAEDEAGDGAAAGNAPVWIGRGGALRRTMSVVVRATAVGEGASVGRGWTSENDTITLCELS